MLKTITVLTGTAMLIFTSSALASAQEQPTTGTTTTGVQRPQMRGVGGRMMRRRARRARLGAMRQLNLTDAQRQQAQSIVRANIDSNQAARQELIQLLQQRRQGSLTEADQARARELRKQLLESRTSVRTQLTGLLTAEQKLKLEEMRKNRRERRERFGRRGMNRAI